MKAFTLIELLVVVAIIGVLAALLFPVIGSARRSARATVCLSTIRSAGHALSLYASDFDDSLPSVSLSPSELAYTYASQLTHDTFCLCKKNQYVPLYCWLHAVKPYLTMKKAFCFMDPFPKVDRRRITSYEYKLAFAWGGQETVVEKPSKVAVMWEQWAFHDVDLYNESDPRAHLNVLFVDGSAKYKDLGRTTTSLFGDGPDLHQVFPGAGDELDYAGEDFVD